MNLISGNKKERFITVALFFVAIILISFHFTLIPKVWVDEGVFTSVARNIAVNNSVSLKASGEDFFSMRNALLTTSYPVLFPVATSFYVFGVGIMQARFPMLLYMFVLILSFFLFNKRRFGFMEAVLSVLLIISFAPFYGNGRPVQGEVPALALFSAGLYFLLLYEQSGFKSKKNAIISGLFFGLCCATKPLFLVGVGFALFFSLLVFIRRIENKKNLSHFLLGFIPPILGWMYFHFPTLDDLKNMISTFLYFGRNHGSEMSLFETILSNLLRFFTELTPISFALLFGFILVSGSHFAYKKQFWKFSVTDSVVILFSFFNFVAYLFGTGWYRYFFPAHVLVYLLFPGAFLYVISLIPNNFYKKVLMLIPISLIIVQFLQLTIFSETPLFSIPERNGQFESILSNVSTSSKVLFYNSIEGVVFLRSENYGQYLAMEDFLVFGDKDSIYDDSYDYMIIGLDEDTKDHKMRCYSEEWFSQYLVLIKDPKCK